ncbi:hypothetical protein K7432_016505 [Basidiobolus ranarum]|uniref:G-protein coupled receptors family 2 profile 2 domain-containing protein n=1 Tax=Basidiobolus ranarum TaxID=34480 RepID=A0ABR2VLS6_9FUNG
MEAPIPPLRKEQIELVLTINVSIDIVSLLCSLFAILALSVLCPYAKGQTNRVSIRLLIYIAIMDAMYTAFQIVSYKLVSDSFLCSFSVWALVYFTLASVFLRLAVVINIQLAVVKSTKYATITEFHYLLVATIFPLLLSIAPACANLFGWTTHEGTCWFRDDGKDKNFIWQWFSYYMWVVFSVLYSIITILLIVRYLRKQKSEIQEDMEAAVPRIPLECNPLPASQSPGLIKQTVYRTCWYPIIPTISQSFVMVNALILTARKEIIFPVYLIAITGTALQGTLTAIVFANDPAVEEAGTAPPA